MRKILIIASLLAASSVQANSSSELQCPDLAMIRSATLSLTRSYPSPVDTTFSYNSNPVMDSYSNAWIIGVHSINATSIEEGLTTAQARLSQVVAVEGPQVVGGWCGKDAGPISYLCIYKTSSNQEVTALTKKRIKA